MDVITLLNESARHQAGATTAEELPRPFMTSKDFRNPFAKLPTPSPEPSFTKKEDEQRERSPWTAGGYSFTASVDTSSRSSSTFSSHSFNDNSDPISSRLSKSSVCSQSDNTCSDHQNTDEIRLGTSRAAAEAMDRSPSLNKQLPSGWFEKKLSQTAIESVPRDDPKSSYHRFSDSHSSVSSIVSFQSTPHSRVSSVTTISGTHALATPVTELPCPEFKFSGYFDSAGTDSNLHPPSPAPSNAAMPMNLSGIERQEVPSTSPPGSPSDTVLPLNKGAKLAASPKYSRLRVHQMFHAPMSQRSHKRAISAPDYTPSRTAFARRNTQSISRPSMPLYSSIQNIHSRSDSIAEIPFPTVRDRSESRDILETGDEICDPEISPLTRKESLIRHSRGSSDLMSTQMALITDSAPTIRADTDDSTQAGKGQQGEDEEARCMFVKDCDTGSQLRKAISHLFGRNKSCTLKIPKNVWVYYCRKHYQRIRYRNARTYPINQMELVKVQIRRLQVWSQNSLEAGNGPYIKSWTLSLRKREKNRMDHEKESGRARDEEANTGYNGAAVPDWLVQRLGSGLSTEQILETAEQLHDDIVNGILGQVPEIEFLPDIVEDDDENQAKSNAGRRHSRSQSRSKTPKRKAPDASILTPVIADHGHLHLMGSVEERNATSEDSRSVADKRRRLDIGPGAMQHTLSRLPSLVTTAHSNFSGNLPEVAESSAPLNTDNLAPRRAPQVVPKVQPLGTNILTAAQADAHSNQSYESYHRFSGSSHSHFPARSTVGYENTRSQLTLPPISSNLSAVDSFRSDTSRELHRQSPPRAQNRFAHQRSASAFTGSIRQSYGISDRASSVTNESGLSLPRLTTVMGGPTSHGSGPGSGSQRHWTEQDNRHRRNLSMSYLSSSQQLPHPLGYGRQSNSRNNDERSAPIDDAAGETIRFQETWAEPKSSSQDVSRQDRYEFGRRLNG